MTNIASENDPDTQSEHPSSHAPGNCDDKSQVTASTSKMTGAQQDNKMELPDDKTTDTIIVDTNGGIRTNDKTTDNEINNLTTDELRSIYQRIRAKTANPVTKGGLVIYSQQELHDFVISHRDSLEFIAREIERELNHSSGETQKEVDTTLDDSTTSIEIKTSNDSTNNEHTSSSTTSNDANSSPSDDNKQTSPTENEPSQSNPNVDIVDMNNISIRQKNFKSRMEGTFPELARTFFAKMREWDNEMCIIPFHKSTQNVISHESKLPDDMEQAETWIRNTIDNDK